MCSKYELLYDDVLRIIEGFAMSEKKQKLELRWIRKEKRPRIELRVHVRI